MNALLTPVLGRAEAKRILVVDDHLDAAAAMALFLEHLGHEVHQAHNGLHAIHCARTLEPHLILMDIGMPILDGLEAARRIRRLQLTAQPIIIATTAWGEALDRVASEQAGIDVHLTKPVDLEALRRLLEGEELSDSE